MLAATWRWQRDGAAAMCSMGMQCRPYLERLLCLRGDDFFVARLHICLLAPRPGPLPGVSRQEMGLWGLGSCACRLWLRALAAALRSLFTLRVKSGQAVGLGSRPCARG